ncbi:MAG: hypothetical protein K2G70_03920 [Turicibacter sp.]|nr:hypothetical protein [Turicibacter sp.]
MRQLNPTLYEVIYEWFHQLPKDYDVKGEGNTHQNLTNTQEAIISCLIEQFPKSYRESYEVYRDLFSQIDIFSVYDNLDEINVLALATGSGGDVFGLIHACETFLRGKRINIFTVEGNKDALRSQVNLFRQYIELNLIENDVQLIPIQTIIEPGFSRLMNVLNKSCFNKYGVQRFDLIQSFKWMNEESIQGKLRFYDLYEWMNQYLHPNRVAVVLEDASPVSKYSCDHTVSLRAINDFASFCQKNWRKCQLTALTPTPCIARRLNHHKAMQCKGCSGCYDELDSYIKLSDQKTYSWQGNDVFVMKLASGDLGQKLASYLQDETIGYQTTTSIDNSPTRFCTLDAKVSANQQANAFLVHQHLF